MRTGWPDSADELIHLQRELGRAAPAPWHPEGREATAGCFVCFARGPSGPGRAEDEAWAAAALLEDDSLAVATVTGRAGAGYEPGLLALREGALLESAVRRLPRLPDVLLVDATGRDHPRRAGLAVQLGSVLGVPTVGVTHRPLAAAGSWPADEPGARAPLLLEGELVGYWLRTRRGRRPLSVHAAWRTDPDTAVEVVLAATRGVRTPEPLRRARRAARELRAKPF